MIMLNFATLTLFITVICVFIANAKTIQELDSTLWCLLLRWNDKCWGREQEVLWTQTCPLLIDRLIPPINIQHSQWYSPPLSPARAVQSQPTANPFS